MTPVEGCESLDSLRFNEAGLIPAIVQERHSGIVLMMAWMNAESLAITLATRQATYWSRSRSELWRKGATSGHTQYVHSIASDCDNDTLLIVVDQEGAACHTQTHSCFEAGHTLLPDENRGDEDR